MTTPARHSETAFEEVVEAYLLGHGYCQVMGHCAAAYGGLAHMG